MTTYQLKPMSVGEILDGAVAVYRRNFGTLISVAVVCLGIPTVLSIYVRMGGGPIHRPLLALASVVLGGIGNVLAGGAVVWAISEAYLGRDPITGDALGAAFQKFGKLFVSGLAKYLVIGLGTLFFLVPGIIVACGYAVVVQAVMLEALRSGTDALGRSWRLTKGFKGKAFVLGLVMLCLIYIPVLAATGIAQIVPVFRSTFMTLGDLLQVVVLPAVACVFTLFYYDLRVRKEAFDLEQLSAHLTGAAEPAGA